MEGGFVYILQSKKNGRYYVGSALNINTRLAQHNSGRVRSTCNKGPWVVVFSQYYSEIRLARQVEYKIKKVKRKEFVERIVKELKINGV